MRFNGIWKKINIFDGLAHNIVNAFYTDPQGILWIATDGGVSRYDGKTFVNLTTKDGLAHNKVNAIHIGPDGITWFGTEGGISRYDGKTFVNLTDDDGLVHNGITTIHGDPDGVLWFGTYGGVSCYDGKNFVNFTTEDGLAENQIYAVYRDFSGSLWFGTWDSGVLQYDGKEFVNFTTKDGLAHNTVRAIYQTTDGILWFGTYEGISRYDGKSFTNFTARDGLAGNLVRTIHGDSDGVLWFGTADGGVSRYDGKTFANITIREGLADNNIRAIHRSPDGSLWFGTGVDGASRYDEKTFISFNVRDGLAGNVVRTIYNTTNGDLWIGTQTGACCYDGKQFTRLTTSRGLIHNSVWAIHGEADGTIWFGTEGGVSRYDGKSFTNFSTADGLAGDFVRSIFQASDGNLWFGTRYNGVSEYMKDSHHFINFTTRDGLAGNAIRSIHQTPDGIMWFGTDGGISFYDGKKFTSFTAKDGLANHPVWAIYQDQNGLMWFGTEGGVLRYDNRSTEGLPRFVTLTTEDGLVNDFVTAIYASDDGTIWFGTSGWGVSRCLDGVWSSLDTRDGLASNLVYSISPDARGSLWFATDRGITHYQSNRIPPRAQIIAVTTDRRYTEPRSSIQIAVDTRATFECNSVDFKTHPQKRLYRFRVYDASDSNQQFTAPFGPATKENRFDWVSGQPGSYNFQVIAIDRDGNYSEPATMNVIVQSHPEAIKLFSLQAEVNFLRREVGGKYQFESIIGNSVAIKQVRMLMEKAIDSGLTVLILGDTGTGKELVAKAIHYNSSRKDQPLLECNCGAIPRELVASELFGHRKGAFTGADRDNVGLFEAAIGGTVLLDEIGEMPHDAQVSLLRVLQERKIQRLGEFHLRDVDVRIITMTNRDLEKEIEAGKFRSDLLYRLNEFPIRLPSLRERLEDVPLLAEYFLNEACRDMKKTVDGFAPGVLEMLKHYFWPGNVREFRNEVRRAVALVEESMPIQTYHFSSRVVGEETLIQEVINVFASRPSRYREVVDDFERRYIRQALESCQGNRLQTAKLLGIDRKSLYEKLKRLNID